MELRDGLPGGEFAIVHCHALNTAAIKAHKPCQREYFRIETVGEGQGWPLFS